MNQVLFTKKRHISSDEIREKMNFQSLLNLLDEMENQVSTIFETAPMESFEQVTALYSTVTDKGHLVDELQFLNHSVN